MERTDEALGLDPDLISTACPFCMVMLSDAVTAKQQSGAAKESVQVLDVSQILARSLVAAEPALVGAGSEDLTVEAGKPVLDDPARTAVADYPQLAEDAPRTAEGSGPAPTAGGAGTSSAGDAPGGASEGGSAGGLGGPKPPEPRPSGGPDTAP